MGMTINITKGTTNYEFYGVPDKIGKAIITLLDECENDNSSIVSAQSEAEDTISTLRKYQQIEQLIADYEEYKWEIIDVKDIREIIDGDGNN